MVIGYAPGAVAYFDSRITNIHTALVNFSNKFSIFVTPIRAAPCKSVLSASKSRGQLSLSSPEEMCQVHDSISSDDEFRSSRNIAISLFRRYRNVVDRGGVANLKEFISAGVNAYALGCTDEGLRKELVDMKESGVEIEGMQAYGGSTSLKSKIASGDVEECILWLSIIFITILCTPQPTIVRWSSTPPVSDEERLKWKGFCALIANAYYVRGMAWLPVKTLQLEQMAVVGQAEEPSVVASLLKQKLNPPRKVLTIPANSKQLAIVVSIDLPGGLFDQEHSDA